MGFIEIFIRKEDNNIVEEDIHKFILAKVEENINLDYKDIQAYSNFDELSRDVSAFANSEGGLILLGVSTEEAGVGNSLKKYPKAVTWGSESLSKEQLEDNIMGKVHPRIDELKIVPIRKGDGSSKVIFLIDIPQSSNPPHMAADNRYYKRLNFRRVPMEHYEVSDLFGKRRKSVLTMSPELYSVEIDKDIFSVRFNVRNVGKAVAKNMMFSASIMNVDIVMSTDFQRLDELRGGIPSIQFSSPLTIFYPIPVLVRIGEVSMKIKNKAEPVVVNYNLVAEDTPYLVGEFRLDVSFLKMAEEKLKQGQKLYLLTNEMRTFE